MTKPRAYLDWNADAPLCEAARQAMLRVWELGALNPSSAHAGGQKARAIIEEARHSMARLLGCASEEIIFTAGGTEADNMAVRGAPVERFIVSFMEHPAVMKPAKASGKPVTLLEVDGDGKADPEALERHLSVGGGRALVCLMFASNESGTLQPVREAVEIARRHGALVLCDAVQGAGKVELNFADLGVDMLAISAHKFGGPQGVGALIVREGLALEPLVLGGGQERRRRAGTENVAGIAGMAAALETALEGWQEKKKRIRVLRNDLETGLKAIAPEVVIFAERAPRMVNTTWFAHPRLDAQAALMAFDLDGVAISAGSACHSGKAEVPRSLIAMGVDRDLAKRALRVSLGPDTTEDDIRLFLSSWQAQVERMNRNAA